MLKAIFIFSLILPLSFTQVLFHETGEVLSTTDVFVSSLVNEKVKMIHHKKGSLVEKGQILVELNSDSIQAQVYAKKQEVKVIESQLQLAKVTTKDALREYKRYQDLYNTKSTSKQNLDKYQTLHEIALSNEKVLEMQIQEKISMLDELLPILKKYKIHAPFNGTILDDNDLTVGQLINSGDSLLRLSDLTKMKVRVQVPAIHWKHLDSIKAVLLKFDGVNKTLNGNITWIAQFIDSKTRTRTIEISVENPVQDIMNQSRLLSPGMFSFVEFHN